MLALFVSTCSRVSLSLAERFLLQMSSTMILGAMQVGRYQRVQARVLGDVSGAVIAFSGFVHRVSFVWGFQ